MRVEDLGIRVYGLGFGVYVGDSGKEHGNYYSIGFYWGYSEVIV